MKKIYLKYISIILCGLLFFQQAGFAQSFPSEIDISGRFASLGNSVSAVKFRPLHLRSISYDRLGGSFDLVLDKGDGAYYSNTEIKDAAGEFLGYFLVGLSLPNDSFWVNLRPDAPGDIIDPLLAETGVGKILLEADLQLKKDTADATNPATAAGREYWDKLYRKAEELYGNQGMAIPTVTRPWIVPDEVIIGESGGSAYVYKATLKVMLEQDYLKGSAAYSFKDPRQKQLNEYASQIIKKDILPVLTRKINSSRSYAPLRQVYYSLILAQWFKARNRGVNTRYSRLIDSKNLSGLYAAPYSVADYFEAYKENFAKGQYNIKEQVATPYGQVVRSYVSGGISIDMGIPAPGQPASVDAQNGTSISVLEGNLAAGEDTGNEVGVKVKEDGTAVVYFDKDQGKAMGMLEEDSRSWVVFSDMLKLSLRNNYYGSEVADEFISDAIRIAKSILRDNKGIAFRLGERSDEVAMVLPGSLSREAVNDIVWKVQQEIEKEYAGYGIARFRYSAGVVEKIKGITGVRAAQNTSMLRDGGEWENVVTVFFVKGGDRAGNSVLDNIKNELGLDPLGKTEEVYPPYLPGGAVRLRSAGNSIEEKFELSQKDAEIFQRIAKQEGDLSGVEGLIEKPKAKEGLIFDFGAYSGLEIYSENLRGEARGIRDFIRAKYGDQRAKQIEMDNGYAAFMRRNLHDVLEYAIEQSKSAAESIFVVRAPPDSFYFISCGKGKWQVTLVRQNILAEEGSERKEDFNSIIDASRRKLPVPGKYPFKVINDFDALGHYFGNQLIALDNLKLLEAFNRQLEIARSAEGIMSKSSINKALGEASGSINSLLLNPAHKEDFGFSVSFEAISLTGGDFTEFRRPEDAIRAALDVIDKMNSGRSTVKIEDNTVEFYGDYKDNWADIENEISRVSAEKNASAGTELANVYLSIKSPGDHVSVTPEEIQSPGGGKGILESGSRIVFLGEEALAGLPVLTSVAEEVLLRQDENFKEKIFLLFGTKEQGDYQVKKIVLLPESAYFEQTDKYAEADPQKIIDLIDENAVGENKLLGVLHTHPFDAVKIVQNPGPSWQDGLGEELLPPSRADKIVDSPVGIVVEAALPEGVTIGYLQDIDSGTRKPSDINAYFYSTEEGSAEVFKVVDFNEWVKQDPGARSDRYPPADSGKGGIDLRFIPLVNASWNSLKTSIRGMPQDNLRRVDLVWDWLGIERLLDSGIPPSAERLKEYFAASSLQGNLSRDRGRIISCIADILRMEEMDAVKTDPSIKDMLTVAESGKNGKELKDSL
ncbi:MAG: diguanylate cyclase [Candidatus Omnitrophica bacterium]|nr:diguanylate cyclase [Candidatus Omnitrophota bacterium]